jgi:hypothetical protein
VKHIVIACGLSLVLTTPVVAQLRPAIDLGSGVEQAPAGPWLRQSRLVPALRFDEPLGFFAAQTTGSERIGRLSFGTTTLDANLASPARGPFALSAGTHFTTDQTLPAFPASQTVMDGAFSFRAGASGLFLGGAADRQAGNTPMKSSTLSIGGWHTRGPLAFSISMNERQLRQPLSSRVVVQRESIYTDTTGWYFYTNTRHIGPDSQTANQRWNEVEARVEWAVGRLALSGGVVAPTRPDSNRSASGELNAAFRVAPRAWLTGGVGRRIALGSTGPMTNYVTVGLRFSAFARNRPELPAAVRPAAHSFRVESSDGDYRRIVIHVPSARVVELSGDFTHWHATPLRETSPNEWEAIVPIAAGTHYLNVRVNGDAWVPPPGLPVSDDGFNGRVGVLIIR